MSHAKLALHKLAILGLVCTFLSGESVHAATDPDMDDATQSSMQTAPQPSSSMKPPMNGGVHREHSPEAMAQHVETRIKTLHDKLKITDAQEDKWNDVAQTMRDNEVILSQLIEDRRKDAMKASAVDDLNSYEAIAQAHVDGLKKLIPAFQSLYSDMSDDQKKNADMVFGSFEGHHKGAVAKKHKQQ